MRKCETKWWWYEYCQFFFFSISIILPTLWFVLWNSDSPFQHLMSLISQLCNCTNGQIQLFKYFVSCFLFVFITQLSYIFQWNKCLSLFVPNTNITLYRTFSSCLNMKRITILGQDCTKIHTICLENPSSQIWKLYYQITLSHYFHNEKTDSYVKW